jgi:type IV pilus assembly protein PilF
MTPCNSQAAQSDCDEPKNALFTFRFRVQTSPANVWANVCFSRACKVFSICLKPLRRLGIDRKQLTRLFHPSLKTRRTPAFARASATALRRTLKGAPRSRAAFIAFALLMTGACQAGTSADDADRSMKQFELAVGLQQEGNQVGAFRTLYKALEYDPNNPKAHLLLAHLFLVSREDDVQRYDKESEAQFRRVLEIQAGEYAAEESLASQAHNGLGVLYVHQGRTAEALKELNLAVGDLLNRDAFLAWGNLGWAYLELRNYPKAIDALTRSVRLRRDFCVGHFRLGRAYLATRDFAKAEQALTSAVEADPRCDAFQDAWQLRGEARMSLGNRDDARSDFERCVELQPKSEAGKTCSRYLAATY